MLARDRAIVGFTAGVVFLVAAWEFEVSRLGLDPFTIGSSLGLVGLGIAVISITFYSLTQSYDEPSYDAGDIAAHEVTVALYDLMGTPLDSEKDISPELLNMISKVLGERKANARAALERRSIYHLNFKRKGNRVPAPYPSRLETSRPGSHDDAI